MQTKYTNVILTIIAVCLIFQVGQSLTEKRIPITDQAKKMSEPLRVNIVSVGGDSLSKVNDQIVLPVGVHNTIDTKIVDPMFTTGYKSGIGVVLLNR